MLILLPPSEGKAAPTAGPPVDLATLSFPGLTATRRRVLTQLIALCRADAPTAAGLLGLGPTQLADVTANTMVRRRPCGRAIEVYTGVLYEALDPGTLTPAARRRLDEQVAISSALWGLVRPSDLIPAYRLSGGVSLPGIGTLASIWRAPVSTVLARSEGLVVDLRSSTYAALGPLPADAADRCATVRVLVERNGRRTVVSHSNKATKGRLVRALVRSRRTPSDVAALAHEWELGGFRVETPAVRPGRAAVIDVIVDHV